MHNKYRLQLLDNILYGGADTQTQIDQIWERIIEIWTEHKPENLEKIDQFKKEWNTLDRAYILLKAAEEKYVKPECNEQQLITNYFPIMKTFSGNNSTDDYEDAIEPVVNEYSEKCSDLPELYGTSDLNDLVFDYWHIVNVKTKYFRPWSKFILPDRIPPRNDGRVRLNAGVYNIHSFNKDVINFFIESQNKSVFTVHSDDLQEKRTFHSISPESVQYKSFIEGTDNGEPYYRSVLNVPVNLESEVVNTISVDVNNFIPDTNHPVGKKIRNRLLFKEDKPLLILNKPQVRFTVPVLYPGPGDPDRITLVNQKIVLKDNAILQNGNNMLISSMIPTLGEFEDTYSYNLVENLYNKKYFPLYFYLTRHIFTGIVEASKRFRLTHNQGLGYISPSYLYFIKRRLSNVEKLSFDGISELSEDERAQFRQDYSSILDRMNWNRNDPITHVSLSQNPEKYQQFIDYLANAGDQKFKDILLNLTTQEFIEQRLIGLLNFCTDGMKEIVIIGTIIEKSQQLYSDNIKTRGLILKSISEILDKLISKYIIHGNDQHVYCKNILYLIKMILYNFYDSKFFKDFNDSLDEDLRTEIFNKVVLDTDGQNIKFSTDLSLYQGINHITIMKNKFLNPSNNFNLKDTWGQDHLMILMLLECNRSVNHNPEKGIIPPGNRIMYFGNQVEIGAHPTLRIILQEEKYKYFSSFMLPTLSYTFRMMTNIKYKSYMGEDKLGYPYILFLYRLILNIVEDKYLSEYESKTTKMIFDYMTTGKMNFVDNPELQTMSDRIDELSAIQRNPEEDEELKQLSEKVFLFRNMDGPEDEEEEEEEEEPELQRDAQGYYEVELDGELDGVD